MTEILDTYPEEVALEKVEGLAPDVHLLVGRHLDLPVALGLVRVVPGEVGTLDGDLVVQEMRISRVAKRILRETSCPSARLAFPFLQLKASISFLGRKVFLGSQAFAA